MTTTVAVVALDGVVRDTVADTVISEGRRLVEALSDRYRVVIVADSDDHDLWDLWLARNDITEHAFVITRRTEDPGDTAIRRVRQIERLRGQGASVELLIDPDPGVIAAASHLGVTCLLFLHPEYSRPEFRPDHEAPVTPWNSLVEEIDRTKELRAADTRIIEEL